MPASSQSEGPLSGLSVLITRPLPQQAGLSDGISAAGGQAVAFPLIDIVPLDTADAGADALDQIRNLDRFDILIFVSSNAARIGGQLINDNWQRLPATLELVAVGNTTAETVFSMLGTAVLSPAQGSDSEAVLALPLLQAVTGKRIGIVRGQGGRELLASTLAGRGAEVRYLEVYSRQRIFHNRARISPLLGAQGCDIVTVSSGESLRILMELFADNITRISLLPLVVPSRRIEDLARHLGFADVTNAGGADDEAMLSALRLLALRDDNRR